MTAGGIKSREKIFTETLKCFTNPSYILQTIGVIPVVSSLLIGAF